jgi:hypothetical protein
MMRAAAGLALAALLGAPFAALAGEPGATASEVPPYAHTFEQLDTNRDGLLSFSEAFSNPKVSNSFQIIDTNADGFLSLAEIRAALGGTVFGGGPVVSVPAVPQVASPAPPVPATSPSQAPAR